MHSPFVYHLQKASLGALRSLLLLEVRVGAVADQTANEEDGVQADAETSRLVVGSRGDGAGEGRLGLGVAGLRIANVSNRLVPPYGNPGVAVDWDTYVALQSAHLELLERLPGLIAVADILESLGGVLAANVEKDLLTAAVWGALVLARVVCCLGKIARCGGIGGDASEDDMRPGHMQKRREREREKERRAAALTGARPQTWCSRRSGRG